MVMYLSARAALRAPCVHILAPASSCPVRAAPSGPGHRLAVTVLAACFLVAVVPVGLDPGYAHPRPGLVESPTHWPTWRPGASGADEALRAVREVLQQVRVTRHDNLVVSVDAGGRIRVLEALLRVAHREHVNAVSAS